MERIPTRCGYCGLQTVTRAGRCPSCGHEKRPPKAMEPAPPRGVWQAFGWQITTATATLLMIVMAILLGSQVLLFLAILVLCALGVLFVVANGTS
jgi:hypothetical protein